MQISRRELARRAAALIAAGCASVAAFAQDYPSKPVKLVIGFGAGSSVDTTGRMVADKLGERWKQSIVVENRPGAGGNIASEAVARARPDGYTLLLTPATIAISPALYPRLSYDPAKDLLPVTQLSSMPHVLVAGPQVKADSIAELIQLGQSRALNFASSGAGGSDHIAGELFRFMTGTPMVHVPYKGGQQAMSDVIGGQVDIYFAGAPVTIPFIEARRIKALGVTTEQRVAAFTGVPTVAESGVAGYSVNAWYGLFAPRETPGAIAAQIARDVAAVLREPEIRRRLVSTGLEPIGSSPADFAAFVDGEYRKWADVVQKTRISLGERN